MRQAWRCVLLTPLWLASCSACNAAKPAAAVTTLALPHKPTLVPGQLPVAAFVAQQLKEAPAATTLVYVGASWCEPCQRFHRALEAGELDASLRAVRFVEYDYDVAKVELVADGYASRLIPLFALPNHDGRASSRAIEGSIKGPGAVGNILPRLQQLLKPP